MLLFTILFLLTLSNAKLNTKKVTYAVNCGGPRHKGRDGVTYQEDDGYSGGNESDHGKNIQGWTGTDSPEIYQTERWADEDFSYQIPMTQPGSYVLILKFSEVYFQSAGQKIFSVKIGDTYVVNNLDIFAKVEKRAAAYDEFVEFDFRAGKIYVGDVEVTGGYTDGKLQVDFVKSFYDNPKINAIVLVMGSLSDTQYFEQLAGKEQAEQIKHRAKDDYADDSQVVDDDQDFEEIDFVMQADMDEDASLMNLLMSTPGMIFSGSIVIFLLIFFLMPTGSKPKSK